MRKGYGDRSVKSGRSKKPVKDPKDVILVFTEGEVTEPQYLTLLQKHLNTVRLTIEVIPGPGVPKTLVAKARDAKKASDKEARRDTTLKYQSIWCVFDVDSHPNMAEAKQTAEQNNIKLAISNPCFELWLLLHHGDYASTSDRKKIRQELKGIVPQYDKHVDFEKHYQAGYDEAVRRARKLDELADSCNDPGRNPTTGVYRLTELIAGRSVV